MRKAYQVRRLTFPDADDLPAFSCQSREMLDIALFVSPNFVLPICRIGFHGARSVDAPRASVPEAAMNKNADAAGRKHQIWPSRQSTLVKDIP
jgi:hypothetical protein